VTLYGKTLVSRMGLSLLKSLHLDSYATSSYENYEKKVLEMAEESAINNIKIDLASADLFKISYL
jgi:predicted O-linked N-acetylglucosamine transferase (SPINDLY family)